MERRIIIYAKDVAQITGKSPRYARVMLSKVRLGLGKEKHHLVTLQDFCRHYGLEVDDVMRHFR